MTLHLATTPSRDGRTALAYASVRGPVLRGGEMVSLLLSTGKFELQQRYNYGKTALDWGRVNTCVGVVGTAMSIATTVLFTHMSCLVVNT